MAWAYKPSDHVRRMYTGLTDVQPSPDPVLLAGSGCRAAECSCCRHHHTAGEEHPAVSAEAKCNTFSSNAIFQMAQKSNMDLILCAHRMVSSGRLPNTLCILHHMSHREQRHNYMGTMTEFFKRLELDMWETGENVCLFPVPQSFSVSCLPALTPSCSITSRGDTTGAKLLKLCSYPLHWVWPPKFLQEFELLQHSATVLT